MVASLDLRCRSRRRRHGSPLSDPLLPAFSPTWQHRRRSTGDLQRLRRVLFRAPAPLRRSLSPEAGVSASGEGAETSSTLNSMLSFDGGASATKSRLDMAATRSDTRPWMAL